VRGQSHPRVQASSAPGVISIARPLPTVARCPATLRGFLARADPPIHVGLLEAALKDLRWWIPKTTSGFHDC
jgi:hypothetical protein